MVFESLSNCVNNSRVFALIFDETLDDSLRHDRGIVENPIINHPHGKQNVEIGTINLPTEGLRFT